MSDGDDLDRGIEPAEVGGIGGHDPLAAAAGTDDDMCVRDVGRTTGRQQPADVGGVHPVEGDDVRPRRADEPGQLHLPVRPTDGLRQSSGRDGHHFACFADPGEERNDPPVAPIQGDQATRVERDPWRQATAWLGRSGPLSTSSAQARSSGDNGPPDSSNA